MPNGNLLVIKPDNSVLGSASTVKTAKKMINENSAADSVTGKYVIVSVKEEVELNEVAVVEDKKKTKSKKEDTSKQETV